MLWYTVTHIRTYHRVNMFLSYITKIDEREKDIPVPRFFLKTTKRYPYSNVFVFLE